MQTVMSKDGTSIAYEKIGNGPAVILITGAMGTRSSFVELANLLSPYFTVYYYDRRGRGDSSDTKPYSVEKEIEDIDALILETDGSVYLYGISSGGWLTLEAASQLGNKVKKLAIYEPPYDETLEGQQKWREYYSKLKELVNAGNRDEAVTLFMKYVGVPNEMIEGTKLSPMWQEMKKISPTLLYDAACMEGARNMLDKGAKKISAPVLVLDGGESLKIMPFMHRSAEALVKALPNAKLQTLDGQSHNIDPKVLAPILEKFFKE